LAPSAAFASEVCGLTVLCLSAERSEGGRERPDCRRGRKQGGERVAAVEKFKEKRKPAEFFGHRNSKTDSAQSATLFELARGRISECIMKNETAYFDE